MIRIAVPVQLGCCHDTPRCALCNPPPGRPDEALVRGLIAAEGEIGDGVVGFFGGPPPDAEQVRALDGRPFIARVRPDLLSRADADRLITAGAVGFELDALTFDDMVLRGIGRRHRRALVLEQASVLRARGVRVGVVLAIGLPGSRLATSLDDARTAVGRFDTARLHPVLVLARARLRDAHLDGRYTPLELGEAVTACRALMDVLEPGGVAVIRVGQQPGPDGLGGRAVAGPRHTSIRELVEARRALEALQGMLADIPAGARVEIRCAPEDVGRVRGPHNQHVRTLRADHGLADVAVRPDPELPRGAFRLEVA